MRRGLKPKLIRKHKRLLWPALTVLVVLVITLGIVLVVTMTPKKAALQPVSPQPAAPSPTVNPPASAPIPEQASAPAEVPVAQVTAPQNCKPYATFDAPPQLDLINRATGLTQVIQAPSHYQIFGNTSAQIRSQINQCAPNFSANVDEFAAATGYSLSWKYSSTPNSAGTCSTSDVKVGLHVNMIQPLWRPTSDAGSGLTGVWQQFITNLTAHENGHVSIDKQYASQLLRDLQSYTVTDCGSLSSGIQAKVFAAVAAIGAANDSYDAQTNHGATQGAIIH